MKGKMCKRVIAWLLAIVFFIIQAAPSQVISVEAADDENKGFALYDSDTKMSGGVYVFSSSLNADMQISVKKEGNVIPADEVKWSVWSTKIATIKESTQGGGSGQDWTDAPSNPSHGQIHVHINGPGVFTISCRFMYEGEPRLIEQDIQVNLNVEKNEKIPGTTTETGFQQIFGENTENALIITDKTERPSIMLPDKQQIYLTAPMKNDPELVKWTPENANIVSVEVDAANNVYIVPKSAGITKVIASTTEYSKVTLTDSFYVVVRPKLSPDTDNDWHYLFSKDSGNECKFLSDEKHTIYTNGIITDGKNPLTYSTKVISDDNIGTPVEDSKNMLNLISDRGNYVVTGSKAGKYEVTVSPVSTGSQIRSIDKTSAKMNIYVPLEVNHVLSDATHNGKSVKEMNVGDSFNIMSNSNFQKYSHLELVDEPANNVLSVDEATGIIKANKKGKETITVKLRGTAGNYKYNKMYGLGESETPPTWQITFNVIDGISLNQSEAILPVGKTLDLKLTTSNNISPITWESSDPSIASIEAKEKTAVVTGVAPSDRPVTITASQEIDGVTKVATCKVFVVNAVESITLSPSELELGIGKTEMINAEFLPQGVVASDLMWESTNPAVVDFDKVLGDGEVAVIKGVAPGEALIYAVNKENSVHSNYCKVTIKQDATGLSLDATSKVVYVGDTTQLKATLTPANADASGLKWSSANESIATVDSKGLVKGVSVGQTVIVVRTADGKAMKTCTIYVKKKATGITLETQDITIKKGGKYTIKYKVTPEDANDINLVWTSMNTAVAEVDANGTVTAKEKGSAIIMAKTPNGEVVFCNVTVVESATGLVLNYKEKKIARGKTFKLRASILPNTATNPGYTWVSSNKKIATVSSGGTVKGVKGGTAIITCTTKDKKYTATCVVTVTEYATKVKLNKSSIVIGVKKSYTLKATVTNASTTNKKVSWKSSNKKIATVNSKGKVVGKKKGYCTITATAKDGSGRKASCKVRVVTPATSISLNKKDITMIEGKTFRLKATVKPKKATIRSVSYSSSNKKVATVQGNGMIMAIKPGVAKIKVTTKDNTKKNAYCYVHVIANVPSTGITIAQAEVTMVKGDTVVLQKNIQPANTTDSVTWSSDNKTVASVNSKTGKVVAKSPGIATVTVFTSGGQSATTKITVVGLNQSSITLQKYTNYQLQVIGMTAGVIWNTANPAIATVVGGRITTHSVGTTYIYAYINGCRLTCRVKVVNII